MTKILFVCLGNICRSPAAEAIMKQFIKDRQLSNIICDSAGTSSYHSGHPADSRMRQYAKNRNFILDSLSRQFIKEDFKSFDYIITMDDSNYSDVLSLTSSTNEKQKIFKMLSFARNVPETQVPDPYPSGQQGFEHVLDLLEISCEGLLEYILKKPCSSL